MSIAGMAALGAFGGPWNVAYHGAELEGHGIGGFIRGAGFFGVLSSYIFLILFFSIFVKVMETADKVKDKGNITDESIQINRDKLSKDVKREWTGIYWLTLFAGIFGFIAMFTSTVVNEGFVGTGGTLTTVLKWLTIICGLGGTGISLALIIGYLIVMWPKTKDAVKSDTEIKEDQKLYNVIPPNNIMGIIMSIFYLFPVITILVTEFDENLAHYRTQANLRDN